MGSAMPEATDLTGGAPDDGLRRTALRTAAEAERRAGQRDVRSNATQRGREDPR